MAKKLESSIPGMRYPSGRDHFLKTAWGFLEGRRKDDGAEGLWRVHDGLYDLESFAATHPGGAEWIAMTKGTDITEAFECHHITDRAERLLPKFFVRPATSQRSLPYTFAPDGFYRRFKGRVREALKNVDYHRPATSSKLIADSLAAMALATAVAAAAYKSWSVLVLSSIFLTWTVIIAHNFFHQRDNFRMYYFDLSLMSSKEWRVSHSLSHHLYPNTLWDMEVYAFEPFLEFLPRPDKSWPRRALSLLISPTVMTVAYFGQAVKRYYSILCEWRSPELRDLVPFLLPAAMSWVASSPSQGLELWLVLIAASSFIFHFVGLTAAHHHPEIFHDGDVCRKDLDWGLMELDAVRGRRLVDESLFLILTNFGSHGLHHLLPTVDHAYLELCVPAFRETCREFGVKLNASMTSWQLIRGQYEQLARAEPRAENFHKTAAA
ncbi:hypothetical protein TKK_0003755 [Trichogramma kaykai]|uniref:Cytochrome b5 heme-binding domain-containing protein n=1 Tax=Trichogramma kaykai TaxID=54128 RepID=A0ABD2XMY2_9HYME